MECDGATIRNTSKLYFSEVGPNVEFIVEDFSGDSICDEQSVGTVENDEGQGRLITYPHVTEHRIDVSPE